MTIRQPPGEKERSEGKWLIDEMEVWEHEYVDMEVPERRGIHDRHFMGLFPRSVWLEPIAAAGFEPLVVPLAHSSYGDTGHEVFLGRRLVADGRN